MTDYLIQLGIVVFLTIAYSVIVNKIGGRK